MTPEEEYWELRTTARFYETLVGQHNRLGEDELARQAWATAQGYRQRAMEIEALYGHTFTRSGYAA